jgi:cobyrinic acid a,c-diamide synthase
MYLSESINGISTVGFFRGGSYMTNKLQNFGYAKLKVKDKKLIGDNTLEINCHEFHKSYVKLNEEKKFKLTKIMYNDDIKKWSCGYIKNNTIAMYAHVHFFGNIKFLENLLK